MEKSSFSEGTAGAGGREGAMKDLLSSTMIAGDEHEPSELKLSPIPHDDKTKLFRRGFRPAHAVSSSESFKDAFTDSSFCSQSFRNTSTVHESTRIDHRAEGCAGSSGSEDASRSSWETSANVMNQQIGLNRSEGDKEERGGREEVSEAGEGGQGRLRLADASTSLNTTSRRTNPFEEAIIESIENNTFSLSPSMFAVIASSDNNEADFQWSIEHIAILNPVNITEEDIEQSQTSPDPELNARAQRAIEAYWSSNQHYIPSPDLQQVLIATPASALSAATRARIAESLRSRSTPSADSHSSSTPFSRALIRGRPSEGAHPASAPTPYDGSPLTRPQAARRLSVIGAVKKRDSATQTSLTIKPSADLDILALFGAEYIYQEEEEEKQPATPDEFFDANNSFSRRRLFFDEEEEDNQENILAGSSAFMTTSKTCPSPFGKRKTSNCEEIAESSMLVEEELGEERERGAFPLGGIQSGTPSTSKQAFFDQFDISPIKM